MTMLRISTVVTCLLVCGCTATPGRTGNTVRIIGSDTMFELNRRLAEEFMRSHLGDRVIVEGGGSGVGIEALIEGRTSIAAASRPLTAAEVANLYERHQTLGVRFLVAQDALSVFVNTANPVRDLSLRQLKDLFAGVITDWRQVGGRAEPVHLVVRPPSSGTHRFFRDHVLDGGAYATQAATEPTTRGVLAAVAHTPAGIGYGGVAYRDEDVVQIAVDGVQPTRENVGRGVYPLARYLVFFTTQPPTGLGRRFIEWSLGREGQRVVAEVGYIPLWPASE